MPLSDSIQNLVGYCFPCCDPNRDESDSDEENRSLQQERRDRMNETAHCAAHSRTVSWASFFTPALPTAREDEVPEARQSVQSMQSVQSLQSIRQSVRHSARQGVRHSMRQSVIAGLDLRQSVQSMQSISTLASLASPEIISSPRFAVSVYSSARISTEQPRIVDVQTPSRPMRARANTVPVSPISISSPVQVQVRTPGSSRGATFAERFDAIAITNNADLADGRGSIPSPRRQTVSVCNFSRPTMSMPNETLGVMEDDWSGRSPIRRLPSLRSATEEQDNENLSVNRDILAASPAPSSMSSGSHQSWAFQPLFARPAQSTATATPTDSPAVFSPVSDINTPLTPPDRQPLSEMRVEAAAASGQSVVRRRKIIQALEEKNILERRLIELEKMIASRRAEADRALANLMSEEDDEGSRSIGSITDSDTNNSDDAPQGESVSTDSAPERQRQHQQSSIVVPVLVPRSTQDSGVPVGPDEGPLAHRRPRRRPHLTRLQIDTAAAVVPALVAPAQSASNQANAPTVVPVASPSGHQRTPSTANGISSAVSRISNWLFGSEDQYVRNQPRTPSFGGYAAGRSPRGGRFIQAHHLGSTSPYMTAATISSILRQHGREQNPEDIIARDPAPPYQEVDPNPSPSFQSVISGSSPEPSPAAVAGGTPAPFLTFESQRQPMTVL